MKKLAQMLVVVGALGMSVIPSIASAQGKTEAIEAPAKAKQGKKAKRDGKKQGKKHGPAKLVKQYTQGHMRLAEHYMLNGDYGEAANHYQAVIAYTPKAAAPADAAADAEKRRGKKGGRLHKTKLRAYMGAAVASQRMGAQEDARRYAQAGLNYSDANRLEKGSAQFERFLADPAGMAQQLAPEVKAMEEELDALEAQLPR